MTDIASATIIDIKDTRASQLVRQIREEILRGEIAPGSKINIERLRERLDVSLSPLREALSRLSADGLVEMEHNRGFKVQPLSLSNLAEITQLRLEFETLALRQSIELGDINWESDVLRTLHRLNSIVRDPAKAQTLEDWEDAHIAFHLTLLAGSRMPLLQQFCRILHNLNDRYRRILLKGSGGDRNTKAEHSAIAEAAIARKADPACAALRNHIQRTGTNLRDHLIRRIPEA